MNEISDTSLLPKKAFVKTYGCQMNEQDSTQMQALLAQNGYKPALDVFEADLILINTCAIRDKAVHKIYSDLGRIRPLKEDRPDLIIGIAGCVAEQEKQNIAKRFPFVDLIFGPDHIRKLPEMIVDAEQKSGLNGSQTVLRTGFDLRQDFQFVNILPEADEHPVKAFVNIQKGCDNVCSFCIVPFVRGREVSRAPEAIISEIKALCERGVKEVTLLGQNVNSYGLKTENSVSFAKLLRLIAEQTSIRRLRFTTSHPKDVKSDLIEEFRSNPVLCPQFHLPVQSGSTRILDLMKRHYSREDYLHIINELKSAVPHIKLSTDIIVGFPGETEEDFQKTLSLIDEVRFEQVYSFVYSPRPFTKAAKLQDDVPYADKLARLKVLQDLTKKICREDNSQELGTTQEVLVESYDEEADLPYRGRTLSNRITHFSATNIEIGDLVSVKITEANPFHLKGVKDVKI